MYLECAYSLQILEITVEFSGLFTELDTIDRLTVAPTFSLHRHLCSSGHAGRFNAAHSKIFDAERYIFMDFSTFIL